jgi:predicted nucleotidyltransferase
MSSEPVSSVRREHERSAVSSAHPDSQACASTAPLRLTGDQLEIVRAILRQHLPRQEVRAFGSRAGGTPKPFSDLDLLVLTDEPLELRSRVLLEEAFSESDLPFKVDLVDWSTTDASFRERLLAGSVVLRPARQ